MNIKFVPTRPDTSIGVIIPHAMEQGALVAPEIAVDDNVVVTLAGQFPDMMLPSPLQTPISQLLTISNVFE